MSRYISCLAAAALAGISLVAGTQAQAAPASAFSQLTSHIEHGSGAFELTGHYRRYHRRDLDDDIDGDRDNEDDELGEDDRDSEDDEIGDENGRDRHCGYHKKYVCERTAPRCFKQRECIWYYGREYCRYVQKCVGGGDNYCKWIKVVARCW